VYLPDLDPTTLTLQVEEVSDAKFVAMDEVERMYMNGHADIVRQTSDLSYETKLFRMLREFMDKH
jgi:hypothetical protein